MHKLSKNAETLVFLVPVVPLALALILFCTILHYTELYCTVLNCTVLKCTKCTGLYPGPSSTTKWVLSFFFTGGAKVSNCFHIPVFCLACTQYIVQFSCNNTGYWYWCTTHREVARLFGECFCFPGDVFLRKHWLSTTAGTR